MRLRPGKRKERLRREAAGWLARLEGGSDPDSERSFRTWYEADPEHSAAFDRVSRTYRQAALLRHSKLADGRSLDRPSGPAARPPRYALAAAIAFAILVPAGLAIFAQDGRWPFHGTEAVLLATSLGEIREVTLADGSKVTLDADSSVRVELGRSERRATLERGRARFAIALDPRPFRVKAGPVTVRAAKALLDAELSGDEGRIEMLSGTAQAGSEPAAGGKAGPALSQGQGLAVGPDGTQSYAVPTARSQWPQGILQFDGTPLSLAIAEANRHSKRKLFIAQGLADLKVSGAFTAGDNAALARSLAVAFGLELGRTPQGDFLLSKPVGPPAEKKNGG